MQIDPIKITDYIKSDSTDSTSIKTFTDSIKKDEASKGSSISAVTLDSSFYNKNGSLLEDKDRDMLEKVDTATSLGMSAMDEINFVKRGMTEEATEEISQAGFNPLDTDAHTIVTVVDQIKMNIAKGGGDISKMGGLSHAEIEAMSSSYSQAIQMEQSLDTAISDEQAAYLVKNKLEPTIENLYSAQYSAPANNTAALSDDQVTSLLTDLADSLDAMIASAEASNSFAAVTPDQLQTTLETMIKQDIPLTSDNLSYMAQLQTYEKPDEAAIHQAIDDIMAEGKNPTDAYLIKGYSLMDQAKEAVNTIQSMDLNDLFDVQSRITLTEVQLSMTVEATFTMMKNGIEVNTSDLDDLLTKLRAQEETILDILLAGSTDTKTTANIDVYESTMEQVAGIKSAPIASLGRFSNISQETLSSVYNLSVNVTAEYSRMEATYEAVGTSVRPDLGDNIQKAFQNVDDILTDLGYAISTGNQKAVRILAYNNMTITADSVTKMKNASELVDRTFKNMTPAVVSEMIKQGKNPLDMTMEELHSTTEDLKLRLGSSSEEQSFSEFLWKTEHTEGISTEDRTSFIGIYRLLNTIDKSDGAAIGALISTGSDITMRNLMTAVRSTRDSGREYEVSDKLGALDQLYIPDLSITEQVEKAFLTNRCRDAKESMTPAAMLELTTDTILDMDPDAFASAMENADTKAVNKAYAAAQTAAIKNSYSSYEKVAQIIEAYNIPSSANMINAIRAMYENNNQMVKDLYGKYSKQTNMDIDYLIEETWERFSEACKTPEEMAEAQEILADIAENVMKTMLTVENVNTIDLNGMQMVVSQCKAHNIMARENETYHIPIMVADEAGALNLKIVHGKDQSGLVKIALSMESTGTISTTFHYEAGQVDATIDFDNAITRDTFANQAPLIAQTMQETSGLSFSFSFGIKNQLSVNDIYNIESGNLSKTSFDAAPDLHVDSSIPGNSTNNAKQNIDINRLSHSQITTSNLYKIARGYIQVLGEIFN